VRQRDFDELSVVAPNQCQVGLSRFLQFALLEPRDGGAVGLCHLFLEVIGEGNPDKSLECEIVGHGVLALRQRGISLAGREVQEATANQTDNHAASPKELRGFQWEWARPARDGAGRRMPSHAHGLIG
jgi:hypothetical protein